MGLVRKVVMIGLLLFTTVELYYIADFSERCLVGEK